jgi:uncharacterized protein
MSPVLLRAVEAGVALAVRAQPGAKRTAIEGVFGEGDRAQLRIAVAAPPVNGRANEALAAFLAETFFLLRWKVELLSGELTRRKVFLLRGITVESAQRRLGRIS